MQFLGYSVDAVHRTVTGPAGRIVRLEPKAFDLLVFFTEHPNETLSRDHLVAEVWNGKFVTDDAVMVAVYALRQAFDDDSKAPRFIETIRGRGYRWIARGGEMPPPDQPAGHRRSFTIALALILATGVAAFVWAVLRPREPVLSIERASALVRAHARGLFFSERTRREDLELARAEFRNAIAADERFAEPHAALGEVCVRLIEAGSPEIKALESEARREVARALELAPELAYTHAALASLQFVLDRDVARAERSFRHAMDLDPSLPAIRRRYSYLLSATGRFDQATEQARIASELEPTSTAALSDLAYTHVLAGRIDEAERIYREAVRLDPTNPGLLFSLGYCLDLAKKPGEAMESYRRAIRIYGASDADLAKLDATFAASGLPGVYAAWFERFQKDDALPRSVLAFYAASAGRTAEAIALLRESARRGEPGTLWLAVHPGYEPLRGQREFDALVASSFHTR